MAVVEGVREGEAVTEGLPLEAPEEEREAARRGEGVAPVWGLAVAPAAGEKEGAVEREGSVEGEGETLALALVLGVAGAVGVSVALAVEVAQGV